MLHLQWTLRLMLHFEIKSIHLASFFYSFLKKLNLKLVKLQIKNQNLLEEASLAMDSSPDASFKIINEITICLNCKLKIKIY